MSDQKPRATVELTHYDRGGIDAPGFPDLLRQVCDNVLREHGDTAIGAGHFRGGGSAAVVYEVMLEAVRPSTKRNTILELGCGSARLYEYLRATGRDSIMEYSGVDLSELSIGLARQKYPHLSLRVLDVQKDEDELGHYDYILLNSIFNWRGPLSRDQMSGYWKSMLSLAFRHARVGLAFNVMSAYVDWELDDLFHCSLDDVASFVHANLSRHFTIRHDYGRYEHTTYVYHEPIPTVEDTG